jgi:putative membrane protein
LRLAREKGVAVPSEMSEKTAQTRKELSALPGRKFDARYMSVMVQDHTKAVNLFQKEAKRGQDKDLKAFADKTLPVLKQHLDKAQSLVQQASVQQ